jgi:hypothetical protein
MKENIYLGVKINNQGSLLPHLKHLQNRAKYLNVSKKYYTFFLDLHNLYLIWKVYIRPYFAYIAGLIHTQPESTRTKIHTAWIVSFK